MGTSEISTADWTKGILLSILASLIGGASKLSIRKSWLLLRRHEQAAASHDRSIRSNVIDHHLLENPAPRSGTLYSHGENIEDISSTNGGGGEDRNGIRDRIMRSHLEWIPYALRYCGMLGMSVLNPICCVLAMNYASPSILAPFSGLTLVWVILGSPLVNNERPSSQQKVSCFLIITGEVIVAVFGDHTNDDGVTTEEVIQSYKNPSFILYFVGLVIYLAIMAYWIRFSKSLILKRFAWGCSGGAMTGTQNFLKDSLTIVKSSSQKNIPLVFYPMIALAAATAFGGLLLLTACMKRFDATYSSATFVGSFVVSASIMATVHYETFQNLDGLINYIMYPVGIIVLMAGVFGLVSETRESTDPLFGEENIAGFNIEQEAFNSENIFQYNEIEDEVLEEDESG